MSAGVSFKLVVVDHDGKKTGEVRRVPLIPATYSGLTAITKSLMKAENVRFQYEDDDGDRITFSSQQELDVAISMCSSKPLIRVFVEVMGTNATVEPKHETAQKNEPRPFSKSTWFVFTGIIVLLLAVLIAQSIRLTEVTRERPDPSRNIKKKNEHVLNLLLKEVKNLPDDNNVIRDFKSVLYESMLKFNKSSTDPVYPLPREKFHLFLDAMLNGTPVDSDFIPVASSDDFMVPHDIIVFMNTAMRNLKRDTRETMQRNLAMAGVGVEYLVPPMTSYNQEGYVISASSEDSSNDFGHHHCFRAFYDDTYYWATVKNRHKNSFIQVKLPSAKVSNILFLTVSSISDFTEGPTKFRIEASNNGTDFITLLEPETKWHYRGEEQAFLFQNVKPYLYYRIFVLKNGGPPWTCLKRVKFGRY